jgi:peptidoglycan/LPS O-acetylase OafA/YrhL
MLFFLVSGFCIHYPYAALGRSLNLKSYSIRRFLRIYPPYLAVVVLGVLIEWFRYHYFGLGRSSISKVITTIFMLQNFEGSSDEQMFANPSLWSLPIEVQLYIVYPLFYLLLLRIGIKWSMFSVGVVSIGALVLLLVANTDLYSHSRTYQVGNFSIYWIIWCAGALLAEWAKREQLPKWRSWLWLVMAFVLIIAMMIYFLKLFIGIQNLVWAGFYFMVMLWGLTQTNPLRFLNMRLKKLFLWLGLISYSLYLVHYPFFRFCGAIWVGMFGTKPGNFLIPLVFSVLSIPVAYAFYSYIEAPSHRLARKIGGRGTPPRVMSS